MIIEAEDLLRLLEKRFGTSAARVYWPATPARAPDRGSGPARTRRFLHLGLSRGGGLWD